MNRAEFNAAKVKVREAVRQRGGVYSREDMDVEPARSRTLPLKLPKSLFDDEYIAKFYRWARKNGWPLA